MDPKAIADSLAPTLRQSTSTPVKIPEQTFTQALQAQNKQMLDPNNPQKLRDLVGGLAQSTMRSLAGIGNDLLGRKPTPLSDNAPALEKSVNQFLFGNQESPSAGKELSTFLQGVGVSAPTSERYGMALGIPFAILSVLPIGGRSKTALEKAIPTIAKEVNPQVILRTLDSATQRIAPEALRVAAADLAKLTKPTEVQSYIKEFLAKSGGTAYSHTAEAALKGLKVADQTATDLTTNSSDPQLAGVLRNQINGFRAFAENTPGLSASTLNKILADAEDTIARLKSLSVDAGDAVKRSIVVANDAVQASKPVLGASIGFKADVVAGRSSFDPMAARVELAGRGSKVMTEMQSLEKMAAEASAHELGISTDTMASFGGDANLVELADKAEMARQYRAVLEDAVQGHPAEGLAKYTNKKATLGDGIPQLADLTKAKAIGSKGQALKSDRSLFGTAGTRSDTLIEELSGGAYKSVDEANAGLEDLYNLKKEAETAKKEHIALTKELTNESRITKAVSTEEVRAGEVTSQTALEGQKERGFSQTVRESGGTNPEVAAKVATYYDPITNKETLAQATAVLAKGDDVAASFVRDMKEPTALSNAVAQLLIEKYQTSGRIEAAISLVRDVAGKATTQGQATQVLSLWNRLTPGGILRYAEKELVAVGKKLEPALATKLVDASTKLKGMEPGWEKSFETAKMLKLISDEMPTTVLKKVSLAQTMLLLLNPKTAIRNIVGNLGFAGLENVADIPAAMLDSALSLVTGVRTKVPPSILEQSRGALRGGKEAWKEALAGVNTTGTKSQFDIPQAPVFKGKVGRAAETLLNIELRVPDRAFYQAAYDGSIYQQLKAANLTSKVPILEPTAAMQEVAHSDSLYRTFQDDSTIARAFVRLKKGLNTLTGSEDFGMGDVLLKFPRTPANLLARGIDYSPAGFVKMVYESAQPLMGKKFNQKAFVEHFGRALVGTTGLVGTGVLLNRLNILTGKASDNTDIREAKRQVGIGDYQINVSGLKRFVLSGMDPNVAKPQKGDTFMTYDWFQPAAMPIAIGANISENKGVNKTSLLGQVYDALLQGADTVTAQPVLQNIQKFANDSGYYGIPMALGKQAQGLPSSFVPTLLNQIRTLIDNDQRNTYSNDAVQYSFNLVKNKIPFASETLKSSVSPYGDIKEKYQGGTNNLMNVLFNPLFISKYKDDKAVNMVLDIFKQTGDSSAVPDLKAQKQKINGKDVQLGPNQYFQLSKFVGEKTRFYLESFATDPNFQALPDQEKADYIANVLKDIGVYGKIIILGDRPKTLSGRVKQMMAQDYSSN